MRYARRNHHSTTVINRNFQPMVINLSKEGVAVAKIIGGKYNNQIVSVTPDKTSDKGINKIKSC